MYSHIESCFVQLLFQEKDLIIGSLYCFPNTNPSEFIAIYDKITEHIQRKNRDLIIGLDHNLNFLNYENHADTQRFLELIIDNEMFPCITRPTRITHQSATIIDNIIVNKELYNINYSNIIISDLSDHMPSLCILKHLKGIPIANRKSYKRNLSEHETNY